MTEQQERKKILKHLDVIAKTWGIPKLTQHARDNASMKSLRRVYKNCFKDGERLAAPQR